VATSTSNNTAETRGRSAAASKRVVSLAAVGLIAGGGYALLSPQWYTAQITVVPSPPPKAAGGLAGGGLASLASVDPSFEMLSGGSDSERIAAVFRSVSVTDAAIAKFNLMDRYRASYPEDARKEFWEHCSASVDKKPGLIIVTCEDRIPEIAKAIVEFVGEEANRVLRKVTSTSASEERRFLEKRVEIARAGVAEASQKLRDFQEQNGVISLPEQAKAIVSSIATLRADLLTKQMQLSYVSTFASSDEASADQLRRQISVLGAKVKSLEEMSPNAASTPSASQPTTQTVRAPLRKDDRLFPPAMDLPRLQSQLEALAREQKLQETLFLLLVQRFESARVQEVRDTSSFQVLDQPTLPRKRSRPKRVLSTLLGLIGGLAIGIIWQTANRWWPPMPVAPKP